MKCIFTLLMAIMPVFAAGTENPGAYGFSATLESPGRAGAVDRGHYLQTSEFDVGPAPKPGSKTDENDINTLRGWQDKRTKEQCSKARAQAYAEFDDFFKDMSPFASPLPAAVKKILNRVSAESENAVKEIKDIYKRPRPFNRNIGLTSCVGNVPGLAYPSGHASISRLYALILSDLKPAQRAAFMKRADESALNRVIGGAHHPSDIEAGKRLADIIYPQFLESREFQTDVETLRGYMR